MSISVNATGDSLLAQRLPRNDESCLKLKTLLETVDVRFANFELLVHDFEVSPAAVSGGTWVAARPPVIQDLNWLGLNYTTLGSDGVFIDAAVAAGAKGIVNAGVGHANMPEATMNSLREARQKGLAVVVGSRVGSGVVTPTGQFQEAGFVTAMMHNAQKARILLMLALTKSDDLREIQRIFDEY